MSEGFPLGSPQNHQRSASSALSASWGDKHTHELSADVRNALFSMFPSDDPVFQVEFDEIEFLNQQFPQESDLDGLEEFLEGANSAAKNIERALRKDVHEATNLNLRMVNKEYSEVGFAVEKATKAITQLYEKISSVKSKANESEKLVEEFCRDIQRLNAGKRNLTASFDATKNFHLLLSAVDQLEAAAEARSYFGVSSIIENVDDIIERFLKPHSDMKHIADINKRVSSCKKIFEESVSGDLKIMGLTRFDGGLSVDELKKLGAGCDVLEAIGPDCVKRLVDWISQKQLEEYCRIYAPKEEAFVDDYFNPDNPVLLQNIDKRYEWFRRSIAKFLHQFKDIIPKEWNVPGRIGIDFCLITHEHLITVLFEAKECNNLDTQVLVNKLKLTVAFEDEMERYYSKGSNIQSDIGDTSDDDNLLSEVDRIKKKYEREKKRDEYRKAKAVQDKVSGKKQKGSMDDKQTLVFKGIITRCFAPYMNELIEKQRSGIEKIVDDLKIEENWIGDSKDVEERLLGSDKVLHFISKSIKQFMEIDKRKIFYDISLQYKYGLSYYAELLTSKLPKSENSSSVKENDLKLVVRIVNTAEYCSEKSQEIKELIVETIDEMYKSRVDFDDVSESYQVLINKALSIPLSVYETQIGNSLSFIEKANWLGVYRAQENSPNVMELKQKLEDSLSPLVKKLSREYHVYIYKKIAESFIKRYEASLSKIKSAISDSAAQQLLLDAQYFEKFLLTILPKIGTESESKRDVPKIYTNFVKNEMGRIISILKCIGIPPAMLEENFRNLLRNGNTSDLIRIMEFKSMKRAEQNPIIEAYLRKVPATQQMKAILKREESSIAPNIPLFSGSGPTLSNINLNIGFSTSSIAGGFARFGKYLDDSVHSFK
jgi:hypothetical protein